ncbi:MAG: flagellar motor switch protein FliG [Acidimicrobiaceae bacterium]|jgi:flagellar motor switch protein FliG|nr:flagellar motor switch protein FliG [Acidimicrobiaceae bacterium]
MIQLTKSQQAAVVIAQLDEDRANKVLKNMSESEVIELMAQVARLPVMTSDDVDAVVANLAIVARSLADVRQGGNEIAERLLRERLGAVRAAQIMDELQSVVADHPLAFINRIEPSQIVGFMSAEHPQLLAVVLAHVNRDHAARVVERLDDDLRTEVARRVAKMSPLPPDVIRRVAAELDYRLSAFARAGGSTSEVEGVATIVGILTSADQATEKQILADLDDRDPEIAEQIRNEMFVFEDVVQLDDQILQTVLRSVVLKNVALALKGKPEHVLEKFTRNISQRAAEELLEDMASLGPQRLSVVEGAEASIVKLVRSLADAGTITIERGNDELVG